MSGTFDTLTAARKLEAAGMDRKHAEAVAAAIRQGQGALVTTADLPVLLSALETRLYRTLWLQAAGIVVTIAALAGIAVGLASLWSGR